MDFVIISGNKHWAVFKMLPFCYLSEKKVILGLNIVDNNLIYGRNKTKQNKPWQYPGQHSASQYKRTLIVVICFVLFMVRECDLPKMRNRSVEFESQSALLYALICLNKSMNPTLLPPTATC